MATEPKRAAMPQFHERDLEDLGLVHRQLEAALLSMQRIKGETAVALISLVGMADNTICALYNRIEPKILRAREYNGRLRALRINPPAAALPAPSGETQPESEQVED